MSKITVLNKQKPYLTLLAKKDRYNYTGNSRQNLSVKNANHSCMAATIRLIFHIIYKTKIITTFINFVSKDLKKLNMSLKIFFFHKINFNHLSTN
jgi:hypothetical protein